MPELADERMANPARRLGTVAFSSGSIAMKSKQIATASE
jgi:hypothetical protein